MDEEHDISEISEKTEEKSAKAPEAPASTKELEEKVEKAPKEKEPEQKVILEPHSRFIAMAAYTVNRVEPEKVEIPIHIDMKKAEEDYNSIDYMVIDFNRRNGYLHPSSVV